MRKAGVLLLGMLLLVSLSLTGCSEDKANSASVTGPTAAILEPTGTVQGHIMDSVTDEPIVGAIVDIGVGSAVTSATGEFVIRNVPCNRDALNNSVSGTYRATIDMRSVSSPVSMATNTTPRYANFVYYDTIVVNYTSLNDTDGVAAGAGSGTNHDTPVTGLVGNVDFMVGKMAANITGVAAFAKDMQPVGAGYIVKLISTTAHGISGGGSTGGTGNTGNVIMTTTTDASGAFSFVNVESLQTFAISAQSSDGLYQSNAYTILAPADRQTKVMNIQSGVAPTTPNVFTVSPLLIVPTDNVPPVVINVTPETGTDLNLATNPTATVVFTFSEVMRSDAFSNMLVSGQVFSTAVSGLYDKVAVNYLGTKASNIAHSLSWSADRRSLTVSIPNLAPSSIYDVVISAASGTNNLADIYGNWLAPASPKMTTRFSTNGAPTAAAVANLSIVNSASLNAGNSTGTGGQVPILDWAPVSGAKRYSVYRQRVQRWGATTELSPYVNIGTGTGSSYTDGTLTVNNANGMPFVENSEIQLTYNYVVRSVNSDATESVDSNVVSAVDVIASRMTVTLATFYADMADNNTSLVLAFNEPMRESTITNVANYTLAGISGTIPTITSVIYDSGLRTATLNLSAAINPNNVQRAYISYGVNNILDSTAVTGAGNDTALAPLNGGGLCILPAGGADPTGGVLNTAPAGDDVSIAYMGCKTWTGAANNAIYAGANGVCNTTSNADDTQVVGVGNSPTGAAIIATTYGAPPTCNLNNAATDFTLQTVTLAGDDTVTRQVLVTINTAVTDVAGVAIDPAYDAIRTDGVIQ